MSLDEAQENFEDNQSNKTAAIYLAGLMRYHVNDMIGDDTFLDGLMAILTYLNKAKP